MDIIDKQLVDICQQLRDKLGQPIAVNSGCRCCSHNEAVGGAKYSQHTLGKAADLTARDLNRLIDLAREHFEGDQIAGLGEYDTFVHIDVRKGKKARWHG